MYLQDLKKEAFKLSVSDRLELHKSDYLFSGKRT